LPFSPAKRPPTQTSRIQPRMSPRATRPCARILFATLLLLPTHTQAQQQRPQGGAQRSAWYMYFGDHPLTPTWGLHLEGQFRREDLGQRPEQLLLRPGVTCDLHHGLSILVAYTYLRGYPYESGSLGSPSTTGPQPEHRILEELKFKHKLISSHLDPEQTSVTLTHRLRAEQRFVGSSTQHVGVTSWNFAERARYRLTADIPFRWSTAGPRPEYASIYNEIFVNFGPHGGNRALAFDRTYGALGWKLNRYLKLEAGYLFQYTPRPNGIVGVGNHALQISLYSTAPFRRGLNSK